MPGPFVVYWCVRSFIIGDGPTSGFRIDVPCKAPRPPCGGPHYQRCYAPADSRVCRRINWCTSLHQHPSPCERLVRTRHVPSQRRISATIAKRLINIKYRRHTREMKKTYDRSSEAGRQSLKYPWMFLFIEFKRISHIHKLRIAASTTIASYEKINLFLFS